MILTLDRTALLSSLMFAFKFGDLNKYLKILEKCEKWMDADLFAFYTNLSKNAIFTRRSYFK